MSNLLRLQTLISLRFYQMSMKYEVSANGGLQVTIQAGHRLWKLFREYQKAVVNYNLRGHGEEPLRGLIMTLFPDQTENYQQLLERATLGVPKVPSQFQHDVRVYRTRVEIYATGHLIREHITEKLYLAGSNLSKKAGELLQFPGPLIGEGFREKLRRVEGINAAIGAITKKLDLALNDLSIIFEGTEEEHPYVFRRGELQEFQV